MMRVMVMVVAARKQCVVATTTARNIFAIVKFYTILKFYSVILVHKSIQSCGCLTAIAYVFILNWIWYKHTWATVSIYNFWISSEEWPEMANGMRFRKKGAKEKWDIFFSFFIHFYYCYFFLSAFNLLLGRRFSAMNQMLFGDCEVCLLLVSHMWWEHGKSIDGNHRIALHKVVDKTTKWKRGKMWRQQKKFEIFYTYTYRHTHIYVYL